jgi:hypothetical protein
MGLSTAQASRRLPGLPPSRGVTSGQPQARGAMPTTTTTTNPTGAGQHILWHSLAHLPWYVYVVFFGAFVLVTAFPATRKRRSPSRK